MVEASSAPSASGLVSVTNASTGFLRNTLWRPVDPLLMSATTQRVRQEWAERCRLLRYNVSHRASPVGAELPSTDEQPGLDDIAEREHSHAPRFQALLQMAALDHAWLCSLL